MNFFTAIRFDLIDLAVALFAGLVIGLVFQAVWDTKELTRQENELLFAQQEIKDCRTALEVRGEPSIPLIHPVPGDAVVKAWKNRNIK